MTAPTAPTYTHSEGSGAPYNCSHPAASTGDLLIFNIAIDGNGNDITLSLPNGPNGESPVTIQKDIQGATSRSAASSWYYIATGSWSASTITVTEDLSASEYWICECGKVASGEFNSTTPIDVSGNDTAISASPTSPAMTATGDAAGGLVIGWITTDNPVTSGFFTATPTGWTDQNTGDDTSGNFVDARISHRDSAATASESISAASWTIAASDGWSTTGYVLSPYTPAGVNITSVSGDDEYNKGDTGIPIVGTGFV